LAHHELEIRYSAVSTTHEREFYSLSKRTLYCLAFKFLDPTALTDRAVSNMPTLMYAEFSFIVIFRLVALQAATELVMPGHSLKIM
jgi:hypothetical protein